MGFSEDTLNLELNQSCTKLSAISKYTIVTLSVNAVTVIIVVARARLASGNVKMTNKKSHVVSGIFMAIELAEYKYVP